MYEYNYSEEAQRARNKIYRCRWKKMREASHVDPKTFTGLKYGENLLLHINIEAFEFKTLWETLLFLYWFGPFVAVKW